jgi:hypothetical protein
LQNAAEASTDDDDYAKEDVRQELNAALNKHGLRLDN